MTAHTTLNGSFGVRRFMGGGRELRSGSATTHVSHPFVCPVPGCGHRVKTSQALSSHLRCKHPAAWEDREQLTLSSVVHTPGDLVGRYLLGQPPTATTADDGQTSVDAHLCLALGNADAPPEGVEEPHDQQLVADSDEDFLPARPPKRTKDGRIKATRGADVRNRYSALQCLKHIDIHQGALAMGFPPQAPDGKASGTPVPHGTLFTWAQHEKTAELEKRAKENISNKFARKASVLLN